MLRDGGIEASTVVPRQLVPGVPIRARGLLRVDPRLGGRCRAFVLRRRLRSGRRGRRRLTARLARGFGPLGFPLRHQVGRRIAVEDNKTGALALEPSLPVERGVAAFDGDLFPAAGLGHGDHRLDGSFRRSAAPIAGDLLAGVHDAGAVLQQDLDRPPVRIGAHVPQFLPDARRQRLAVQQGQPVPVVPAVDPEDDADLDPDPDDGPG